MVGRRVASESSERNVALIILAVGSAAAIASLLGGVWIVRAGVVVAVVMAAISLYVALSEVKKLREEHTAALRHEMELRIELSERHHADSVAMIERFGARTENLKAIISKLRSQLGAARAELSTLRGNAVWLRAEVAEREAHIQTLTARIAELEAIEESQIIELPEPVSPTVDEIWADDEHPTMLDLRKLDLDQIEEYEQPLRKHA